MFWRIFKKKRKTVRYENQLNKKNKTRQQLGKYKENEINAKR